MRKGMNMKRCGLWLCADAFMTTSWTSTIQYTLRRRRLRGRLPIWWEQRRMRINADIIHNIVVNVINDDPSLGPPSNTFDYHIFQDSENPQPSPVCRSQRSTRTFLRFHVVCYIGRTIIRKYTSLTSLTYSGDRLIANISIELPDHVTWSDRTSKVKFTM